ncbi:MAG TPA: DUF2946 family protein [Roseovarius sp.]
MLSRLRISILLNAVCSVLLSALLAVQVAAAFLPISSGSSKADAVLTFTICSANGTYTMALPEAPGAEHSSEHTSLHGHCPLCVLAADLPTCANHGVAVAQVETRLRARAAAASQTPVQFGGRPDAIRAPPNTG